MIILTTTALTLVLGGATVSPLTVVGSYVDLSDSTYSPNPFTAVSNGTTIVTVLAAPDVNYARQIKFLSINNPNALTASINLSHGTTKLIHLDLAAGSTLLYADGRGFSVMDSTGQIITAAGTSTLGGGSGIASYTVGDLLYASTTTALDKLSDVAVGAALVSGGVGVAPAWSTSPTLTKILVGNGTAALPPYGFSGVAGMGIGTDGTSLTAHVGGARTWITYGNLFRMGLSGTIGFANNADPAIGGADVGISRIAAGVLGLGIGTSGDITGTLKLATMLAGDGAVGTPSFSFTNDSDTGFYKGGSGEWYFSSNGVLKAVLRTGGILLDSGTTLSWNDDTTLARDTAGTLSQRNGVNPQSFFIYNTYTNGANYERAGMIWSGDTFFVGTQALGTGVSRIIVLDGSQTLFRVGGVGMWLLNSSGNIVDQGTHTIASGGAISSGGEISAGTNFQLTSATGALYWASKSIIKSPTDGTVSMTNNASTGFTRLILGTNDATTNGASLVVSSGQVYVGKGDGTTRAGTGRVTAQTAANASIATYTVGAADGSFEVSANVRVTTSTTHNFSVTCAYTDETNAAQTATLNFQQTSSTINGAIANAAGAIPYMGLPIHIRCKAATTITIASTGTFTSVTYNAEGSIRQIA